MESLETVTKVREALESKKGRDILVFDVRATSPVTDYYVIASGATAPQLKAMATAVTRALKGEGAGWHRQSGAPEDGWIVVDYVDVVIHIFLDETRRYYAIEELWAGVPRLT
jgi:ribosome-associated protein